MPQLSTFHSQLSASPAALPYNSELSLWLSVDPLSDKYPGVSPYVYCANNPVRLVDVDGRTPIGAITEGIAAFIISAGMDFISNWLIEGQDYATAFRNVSWGAAVCDAVTTAAMSLFVDGTGVSKTIAKLSDSKAGKLAIGIMTNLVNNITAEVDKGTEFSDINLIEEFSFATFSTLIENGLGKRANELLASVKESNTILYNRCAKYQRNFEAGKDAVRLQKDANKVNTAKKNANSNSVQYATEKAKAHAISNVSTKVVKDSYQKDSCGN